MILVPIQALRAVAALMVVWHHARHEVGLMAGRGAGPASESAILLPWWAGVDLFFVISGFVIVHAGAGPSRRPGGRGRFLAHRVARVVPLYWLVTLVYLALALARPDLLGEAGALARDPGVVLASLLFWPWARPDGSLQPLYGLGWTLNYEMAFYALFALAIGLPRRAGVAGLALALSGLVALGALAAPPLPVAFWADPIVLEFALGAGLALARAEGIRFGAPLRLALALLGAAGLALAARQIGAAEVAGFARPLHVGLPAALIVAAAGLGPAPGRAPAPLPAPERALAGLGDASYALYLVHPFALRLVREGLLRAGLAPALHPWGSLALMVAAAVAAALAVHRLVEAPMTRAARRRLAPAEGVGQDTVGRAAADAKEGAAEVGVAQNGVRARPAPVPRGPGAP